MKLRKNKIFIKIIFIVIVCNFHYFFANNSDGLPFFLTEIDLSSKNKQHFLERNITSDFVFDEFFTIYNNEGIFYNDDNHELKKKININNNYKDIKVKYKNNFITKYDNKILISNNYNKDITMFDKECNQLWHQTLPHFISAPSIINKNFAIIPTIGAFYILNIQNGQIYWQYDILKLHKTNFINTPILLNENLLLFIDPKGKILTFDLINKKILQEYYFSFENFKNFYWFHPPILFNNDNIVLFTNNSIDIIDLSLNHINNIPVANIKKITNSNDQLFILTEQGIISIFDKSYQKIYDINVKNVENFFYINEHLIFLKKNKIEIFSLMEKKIIQCFSIKNIDISKISNNELQLYNSKKNKLYIIKRKNLPSL